MKLVPAITLAIVACTAVPAHAQPSYEVGHAFNGEPETVRIEDAPFTVDARLGDPPGARQIIGGRFPFGEGFAGLVSNTAANVAPELRVTPLVSAVRTAVTFDDLVFASDTLDEVEVDIVLHWGRALVAVDTRPESAGVEVFTEVEIEIDGDLRSGTSRTTYTGSRLITRRSGMVEDLLPGEAIYVVEGFTVPTNTPISLRFQKSSTLTIPVGAGPSYITLSTGSSPTAGFPIAQEVFVVPDGVRVTSYEARIIDNTWRYCAADLDDSGVLDIFDFLAFLTAFDDADPRVDLDFDGDFTIFDFLAFQTAFDAGCL